MPSNGRRDNQSSKSKGHRRRWAAIVAVAVVVAVVLIDLSPFGGNIVFYAKWIECGNKPTAVYGSGLFNSGSPHHADVPSYPTLLRTRTPFCTSLEAEQHGYSANPNQYDFPELKKQNGSWCRHPNDPQSETAYKFDLCK